MGTSARPAEPDAERRVELERVAEEQTALRRVATLVAGGASPDEVLAAVGDEVARTLGFPTAGMLRFEADKSVTMLATAGLEVLPMRTRLPPDAQVLSTAVLDAGGPARVDYTRASGGTAESVRAQGVHWGVGAPIIVERVLWGVMCVGSTEPEPPPSETEARLVKFTELLATAIANAESREALAQLAEEQAALRSVATLVAEGAQPNRVFAAVADEVAAMFGVPIASMLRFDSDGCATVLATLGAGFALVGTRFPITDTGLARKVSETGRSASIDDWTNVPGPGAELCRQEGVRWGIGVPIVVDGTLWGMMLAASRDAMPSGADVEPRLAKFTELVATAIANSQARDQLAQLADEQAALRRVATLVAAGAPPQEVFEAVSVEVAALIPADGSALTRYEADGSVTALSGWTTEGGYSYVGERYKLEGTVSGLIFGTGRTGRVENYAEAPGMAPEAARAMGWHSSVGAPITVEGRLWGVLAVISKNESPLPPDTEQRLAAFTELVATAIANTEAHQELARLAVEQAALRRVATLVAAGAPPAEVFDAVTREVAALIPADASALTRFEAEGTFTPLSSWAIEGGQKHLGRRFERAGTVSGLIFETGRPGRLEKYAEAPGEASAVARELGWRSAVGAPITAAGRLWGALVVVSKGEQPLPPETEGRLVEFTELVATAIANTESRAELEASRARIVTTADATRRQIERDLHDGAQQRLIYLALQLRTAQSAVPGGAGELVRQLDGVATGLAEAMEELGEIARGLHPAILAESGLRPALETLARRSAVPVDLEVRVEGRLPQPVEIAAYYAVAEALTNVAKHARASAAEVQVEIGQGVLHVSVRDDGRGGAGFGRGSGLVGLKDRVEALGGRIRLDNPPGAGTALDIVLPLGDPSGPRQQPGPADPAQEG